MTKSIFSKIIDGEIPSFKVYEDEKVYAFLDIHPSSDGHTLVVPKKQVEFVWDLPTEEYEALMAATKKIALHLRTALNVPFIGEKIIGVDVPHAHIHLVPFTDISEFQHEAHQDEEPDVEALELVHKKIAM